jgi:hypothetical protein
VKISHLHFAVLFLTTMAWGVLAVAQRQPSQPENPTRQVGAAMEKIVVPREVPLHIRITRTAHLHTGAAVAGILTEPIYVRDRLVMPVGSAVRGTVAEYAPVDRIVREQALLNGDVTPLHDPVVHFTNLHLVDADVDVQLETRALIRATKMVRFSSVKKPSLVRQAIDGAKSRMHDAYEAVFAPGKKDRALQLLYGQLPYHPQRIWAGTQFIADLNAPATIMLPTEPPIAASDAVSLNGITVDARIQDSLDSKTAKKGDVVTALMTAPVFDKEHKLILPEGTQIDGVISASKRARSFGRNGQLRFAIRGVKEVDETGRPKGNIYGTLTGAEGSAGQNLSVDSEGNVKANPDKNRFVAPLLLAVTAMAGEHQDGDGGGIGSTTIASNGFGVVARVIALTLASPNVATGFGAYALAQSIYFRFLTRGHEVTFPKDTQVEVTLSTR